MNSMQDMPQLSRLTKAEVDSASRAAVPAVELSQTTVTFSRGNNQVPILSETSLKIADGEFLARVGPLGMRQVRDTQTGSRPCQTNTLPPKQEQQVVSNRSVVQRERSWSG